ncbi:MAG: Glu-tRNA(Gln) amidotransferase subunit GatE [Candidatus Diapherotrites archaeon]|uniref:Glutamyl-tRNA(Gln) amidotransferase subunit E n=1 Tax=Candidatus Iainarchaeum sp. TaxID=3101447 RepID=A0A8T3YNF1_9ARCH|nr:Glu-tRNA(Gln) amidotransferase subunit GatE [Candidatus Diapherotrites archaeon]
MDFDYRGIGLKCGLEVHQQLDTGKLFSRTPSLLREDRPGFTVRRRLRPTASELGEHDKAALEAYNKGLAYIYEGYEDTISLVELDEEPPQPLDKEAFRTILEAAILCRSAVIDEMHVMRKLVIDGSNTSGFQRTMLVATGGSIGIGSKELGIQTIVLEEDAARPMERTDTTVTYRLDRLGIPLIELATEPGIETPEEAKEAARAIGTLLRRTCRVKRGLGTIRQDLNISIRGGARVEVKGVQELEMIDEYVRREVQRQAMLVEVKKELAERGVKKESVHAEPKETSSAFRGTEAKIIRSAISRGETVLAFKLEGFAGFLGKELQPDRRLGTEFADHVKTKTGLKGLFHSDELPNYGITGEEIAKVRDELGCGAHDAFVILAGQKEKAAAAARAVFERALQCLDGVPEETRGAMDGGNTEYLRPLPGAARMYPETDLETTMPDEKMLREIRKGLPMTVEERERLYAKWGLNQKHVDEMKLSNYARLFERAVNGGADARKTAIFLLEGLVEARRDGAAIDALHESDLLEFIEAIRTGALAKEVQKQTIIEKCRNTGMPLRAILSSRGAQSAGSADIERAVQEAVQRNIALVKEKKLGALPALMGDVMKELRGKASGKEISEALRKEIEKAARA